MGKRNPFKNKAQPQKKFKPSSFEINYDDVFVCPECKNTQNLENYYKNYKICSSCGYKDKITADDFIQYYLDSFNEYRYEYFSSDPLEFYDSKAKYADRLQIYKKKYNRNDAIVSGKAFIEDAEFYICIMDFRVLGGSLNSVVGKVIVDTIEQARKEGLPVVIASQSGGARMHEGLISLMQMSRVQAGLALLAKQSIPYISIMMNPTTGGVAASYAMTGDVNIAEEGAIIGFAGRRVIEQNLGEELPDDFQTSEFQQKNGYVDIIYKRDDLKKVLQKLIKFFSN